MMCAFAYSKYFAFFETLLPAWYIHECTSTGISLHFDVDSLNIYQFEFHNKQTPLFDESGKEIPKKLMFELLSCG